MTYNKKRTTARTKIETLEDRRLMSTVSLTDGVLLVQGDALSANKINLSLSEDGSQIQAKIGRQIVQRVAIDTVEAIEVRGGLKADRITIDKKIQASATIYGDAGNDTIVAGGGVDVIHSGLGSDRVTLSYVDTIYDLEGQNRITRVAGAAPMTRNDDTLIESYTPAYFDPSDVASPTLSEEAEPDTDADTETPVVETPVSEVPTEEPTTGAEVIPPVIEEPVDVPVGETDPVLTPGGPTTEAVTTPSVTGLMLYDAVTDQPLYTLNNGDTIDLGQLANKGLTVVANVNGYVKSVKFGYDSNSNYRVESGAPFALNSNTGADFHAWTPTVGTHSITTTGYSATGATGTASAAYKVTFTVVNTTTSTPPASPTVTAPVVSGLTLVDAVTNKDLYQLTNGATINLATLANRGLNVRANVNSAVTCVKFGYDGNASYMMENAAPYTLAGDANSGADYLSWTPTVGTHTLTVTGYTVDNAGGTASTQYTVTFTVTDVPATTPTDPTEPTTPTTPPPTTPLPGDTNPSTTNVAPTVSFINPTNGSSQASPGHYVIRVNAADSDGSVKKVEFFSNGNLISSTVDAPYSAAWVNVSAGTYTLTARATDDDGATKSTSITVTIKAPTIDQTFYVSTGGSDSNNGSSGAPFRSIAKAASLAGAGDTVVIRPGTYRESIKIANSGTATAPITFKAETPGTVVIDGADAVTGWTREGTSNVYAANWAHDFFYNTSGSRVHTSVTDVGYVEQFFYKDKPLKQVMSQSALTAGSFYVNWSTDKVYVYLPDSSNPANTTIMGSVRQNFFSPSSSTTGKHVTIDGLTMRRTANFAQRPAVKTTDGWVVKNSTIEYTASVALGFYGTDNFIYNNKLINNGQEGIMGQGINTLLANNEVYGNNHKGYRISWEAGGGKLTRTDGLYVLNHSAHDNVGPGFWMDVFNTNYTIDGGHFYNNRGLKADYQGLGILVEINAGPGRIQGASFYGNTGSGLSIAESQNVTVRGNYFGDNIEMRNMEGRAYTVRNINIVSNSFKGASIMNSIGTWTNTSFRDFNIKADFNRFDNGGGALYYWKGTSYRTASAVYSALGVDRNAILGSVTIPLDA